MNTLYFVMSLQGTVAVGNRVCSRNGIGFRVNRASGIGLMPDKAVPPLLVARRKAEIVTRSYLKTLREFTAVVGFMFHDSAPISTPNPSECFKVQTLVHRFPDKAVKVPTEGWT